MDFKVIVRLAAIYTDVKDIRNINYISANENLENRKFTIRGKELTDVEKAQIIAWSGGKVSIKIIMKRKK